MDLPHVQEGKVATPVRPMLDYRCLNARLKSDPGGDAPSCEESLRKWRKAGCPADFKLLDIKKAYLQVHVAKEFLKYQTVLWNEKPYVMTQMGFGLSIAPKYMGIIAHYVTRGYPDVDRYIDDMLTPSKWADAGAKTMLEYSLPTKPAEPLEESRVLGLQLCNAGSEVTWRRRDDSDLRVPEVLTKRAIFKWCGRLTGHLPVCNWLRPACSYIKRLAVMEADWDEPVSDQFAEVCRQLDARVTGDGDPARGRWQVPSDKVVEYVIWCDASDICLGVVVEVDGHDIEDRSWLRPARDT